MSAGNTKTEAFVHWFEDLTIADVPLVGGKNASLGEMYRELTDKGVSVPNGFAVSAYAYRFLLRETEAEAALAELLNGLDVHDMEDLASRGHRIRKLISSLKFPAELETAIEEAYGRLCEQYGADTDVAVRSSATAEDLPDASFAGQQSSFLNVSGVSELLYHCKKCFASLFTNRAIVYREEKGFDHFSVALSIGVQKMVRSDLACSGVMFTLDTESGFRDAVYLTAAYGLGENIVQGAVNPDEWYIHKPLLKKGFRPIIRKESGNKKIKMVYAMDAAKSSVRNVVVPYDLRRQFCLTDDEVLDLARMACAIEDHYSGVAGCFRPMDIEWAKDGKTGELFIVQARPETVHANRSTNIMRTVSLDLSESGGSVAPFEERVLCRGSAVGELIGIGPVHVIEHVADIKEFKKGEVLVTDMTDPDWVPVMSMAAAVVTNRGGRTCHAAIISRELGIPCVVGVGNATTALAGSGTVTVCCAGELRGAIVDGALAYREDTVNLEELPHPRTKIMMNIATPDKAFELSRMPVAGVGLAREEFIISNAVRVHPSALVNFPDNPAGADPEVRAEIENITALYEHKEDFFVDKLAEGAGTIAAAFWPRPVILRLSDYKTNEYLSLLGGSYFEPTEDNPMIGWRGASRYYDPRYKDAFALECRAILRVRNEMGLTNLQVMVPFCRSLTEAERVLATMAEFGLVKGENELRVICMCEVPSNVVLADAFLDFFDGFSIGSNDLTQLVLGVDRDSELVAHVFDERNPAVLKMISEVIEACRRRRAYVGICGQGPSDYGDFAEALVRMGIGSISVTPDSVIKTVLRVTAIESELTDSMSEISDGMAPTPL